MRLKDRLPRDAKYAIQCIAENAEGCQWDPLVEPRLWWNWCKLPLGFRLVIVTDNRISTLHLMHKWQS